MKRILLIILLIIGTISACCTYDSAKLVVIKREIADIGSDAQISGPRDDAEKQRINEQVIKIWLHLDELSGIASSNTGKK